MRCYSDPSGTTQHSMMCCSVGIEGGGTAGSSFERPARMIVGVCHECAHCWRCWLRRRLPPRPAGPQGGCRGPPGLGCLRTHRRRQARRRLWGSLPAACGEPCRAVCEGGVLPDLVQAAEAGAPRVLAHSCAPVTPLALSGRKATRSSTPERQQPSVAAIASTAVEKREEVLSSVARLRRGLTIVGGRLNVSMEFYHEIRGGALELRDSSTADQAMERLLQRFGQDCSEQEQTALCKVVGHVVRSTGLSFLNDPGRS